MRRSVGVTVLLVAVLALAQGAFRYKRLGGPPSEFGAMRTPSPINAALSEESALLPVRLEAGQATYTTRVAVDSHSEFQLVLYTPKCDTLETALFFPNGTRVDNLAKYAEDGQWPISSTGQMVKAIGWRFEKPARGYWSVTLTKKDRTAFGANDVVTGNVGHPDAYLFLWNDSPERLFSYFGTYLWTTNSTVGVAAHLYDVNANPTLTRGQRPAVLAEAHITSAKIDMYLPDGTEQTMDMTDDGSHFDMLAGDGVYGGKFTTTEVGTYRITTLFEGTLADGTPFMRSAEHAMVSIEDTVDFASNATALLHAASAASDADQVTVTLPVVGKDGVVVRTYAEVYGTVAGSNTLKAACWVGGYATVNKNAIDLEINKRWLVTAGVTEPLVLKKVTIYDGDVHIPLASAETLPVSSGTSASAANGAAKKVLNLSRALPAAVPTPEMRHGVRPAHLHPVAAAARRAALNATAPSLVLLHGYCAQDNPWTRNNPVEFTDYEAYGDLKQSRLTNTFAENVVTQYDHLPSYGLVGHSQGGLASLHIRNFYWSPNDAVASASSARGGADSARPIQSMGSPYLGVSGAGAALDLGALFGVGCGENFDLTTDGANLWHAGLEHTAKSDVYFYTTVYKNTFLHPRYCNLATNLVLSWPNDGTAEYDRCLLSGANHVENFEGECHSLNMKWPPQTNNAKRNRQINSLAAR